MMRRFFPLFALSLLSLPVHASEERLLASAINAYRAHPSRCAGRVARSLPPLAFKSDVALPVGYGGPLREALRDQGYQAVTVRSMRLVGAYDADSAMDMLASRYCGALLDDQFADVGISRAGNQWQVVLARTQIDARQLGDRRSSARALLAQVNAARAHSRMCGNRRFPAARPLSWSPALEAAALGHSRSMAYGDYFAHQDPDGAMPYDRARAAGYRGRQVGENIAAGQGSPSQAMAGWLASPGHCANLMTAMYTQVGAGYVADTRSSEGVYWTMVFGAP